ncbi:MAG: preprotein translocase subunit SecA, partial [Patescibacteria group bacterium]|nr:preprotein translocase subunit SecA [Patescibacteria group bacterium]
MLNFFKKIFDYNQKQIDKLKKKVEEINKLEDKTRILKDEDFKKETKKLKEKIAGDEKKLDENLSWAYALVREASRRMLGQRHFDVQLMASIALHEGKIAEQKTGEGKTLSAVPALYLNALLGRGVHLVTVNDYLARRDAGWMGKIFHFLGLTTSAIISDKSFIYDPDYTSDESVDWRLAHLRPITRKEAYQTDITYGINSEFGFDYLRDNMAQNINDLVQRDFYYAIIDEADSILIDEARTPHIISAPYEEDTSKYYQYSKIIELLDEKTDYKVDEKLRTANFTEKGIEKIEKILGVKNLYEKDYDTLYHLEAALKAKTLFKKDKDYIVKDNEVIIVDEFTGRLLFGRRFSEGLHQAIEAKEKVPIKQESKTLATISLQNYFRMYKKLAGMTGTAATESEEFNKIYKTDVVVIPTHRPMIRKDRPDMIYKTKKGKYEAVVEEIVKNYKIGRPVLVGTTSIENNEYLSFLLKKRGVSHELLNAKNHEKEASIIARAGEKGSVTVATNMAGRGVDIILGGEIKNEKNIKEWQKKHDEVVALGGLLVIGTERHESRRIDNQLRGRSGRQGDPGETVFYVSLEDDLMRIFGGEQITRLMNFLNFPEDQPLSHPMVSKAIEQAQVKVEGFNFDIRKHLVDYDDVLNKQREIIYSLRRKILFGFENKDFYEVIFKMIDEEIKNIFNFYSINDELLKK